MLNENLIRTIVGSQNFERGETYYRQGAVRNTFRQGDYLTARVEGSQYEPYEVTITLAQDGIGVARCTCPYAAGGNMCKHVAAALIAYVRSPEIFAVRPDPMTLLQDLSPEQLKDLWKKLIEQRPEIADWLAVMVTGVATGSASTEPRRTPLNIESYRRQISAILRLADYSRPYQTIYGITEQLGEVEDQAMAFLSGNDPHSALAILTEIADQTIPNYEQLEDETQLADYLTGWAKTMAEAILSAELTPKEKAALTQKMKGWQNTLADYSAAESIELAVISLTQGWAATKTRPSVPGRVYPPVEDEDDEDDKEDWDEDRTNESYADEFTELKLRIIERTRDAETYLALCLKENAHLRYAEKLVTLGRIDEAVDHAIKHIDSVDELLALAQLMQTSNAVGAAYTVGLRGLTLSGNKYRLGKWLAIFAEGLGHPDTALQAWKAAFEGIPELESYQHLRRLSGDRWDALRVELMQRLNVHAPMNGSVLTEILLDEGDIKQAMSAWDKVAWKDYGLLRKLVDAAAPIAPDWAIDEVMKLVKDQIGRGSGHYAAAADWLKLVKAIYQQHGRTAEWTACINAIRDTHKRKYSLMPLLKGL
jgi:uncharacterized Zn finger protein